MKFNVDILTSASEASVDEASTGYENSVAAHVNGDWGAHNQLKLYDTAYAEPSAGHTINGSASLRVLLTGTNADGTGDAAFVCPALYGTIVSSSGGLPYIVRQPASLQVSTGTPFTLSVKAISATPLAYQWRFNGTNIESGVASYYSVAQAKKTDGGSYDVIISNASGTLASSTATITIKKLPAVGGCFLPDTLITMADGMQRRIADLRPGDRILSYRIGGLDESDEEAHRTWQTTKLTLLPTAAEVRDVYRQSFDSYYELLGLKVTFEHPLLTQRDGVWAFRQVVSLRETDLVWKHGSAIPVGRITKHARQVETCNLNVEPTDVYIANGCIAHNSFWKGTWGVIAGAAAGFVVGGPAGAAVGAAAVASQQ